LEETYFKGKKEVPPVVGLVKGADVILLINSPELAEEFLLNKTKYFDKHEKSESLFSRLTGDSILFAKSDTRWQ